MHNTLESVTYLIKVQHSVLINNEECCYDEIIAQCTDFDKAMKLADSINAKVEKHIEPMNNIYEEPWESYN